MLPRCTCNAAPLLLCTRFIREKNDIVMRGVLGAARRTSQFLARATIWRENATHWAPFHGPKKTKQKKNSRDRFGLQRPLFYAPGNEDIEMGPFPQHDGHGRYTHVRKGFTWPTACRRFRIPPFPVPLKCIKELTNVFFFFFFLLAPRCALLAVFRVCCGLWSAGVDACVVAFCFSSASID